MSRDSSTQKPTRTIPSSLRHKQILDLADERPDASFEAIADEVPSATTDLVESVFEQYGDPAEGDNNMPPDNAPETDESDIHREADKTTTAELKVGQSVDLTDRQLEILHVIAEDPEASQREIGEKLGVTGATICSHMSEIKNNAWEDRHSIVAEAIELSPADTPIETPPTATDGGGSEVEELETMATTEGDGYGDRKIEQLQDRVEALEEQLGADETISDELSIIRDPEFMHKVLHACLKAETISEEEELNLIRLIM